MKNFTDFVEWPVESSISDTTRPFIIGVIGRNPFGIILDEAYSTIKIKNKRVENRYLTDMSEIPDCHLLFIASDRRRQLSEILSITENKSILTVSDTEGFAEEGVHINFYVEDKKLRFEINESAIRESGCSVSYHLLRVATIVGRPDRK